MDNLEKFIVENRKGFDNAVPSLRVWANIDRALEGRPKRRVLWMRRLSMAAAVAFLLIAGGVIGSQLAHSSKDEKSLADISPQHAQMEQNFNHEIDDKLAKLATYRQDGFVKPDLEEIDAVYEDLKKELKNAPPGAEDQIIKAMIETYQTKIDILEQVLEKVQTTIPTNLKTEEHEVSI